MSEDSHYATALGDICDAHLTFRPPQSTSVAGGAAKSLIIKQPGTAGGHWSPHETPYMVEPMDMLASRLHEAEVFVGPARTGKTAGLLLGWMAHTIINDPGDLLFIQMTQDKAREFSKTDVSRAINNSPDLQNMLSRSASDRNTHDIMFKHGAWLRIAWPTVSNVSGSTYRYVAITDLDRIPNAENVDGEGPLFSLALKRTTTFLSRGMCLAESSPGIELEDPAWRPATPHEAPPVTGILGIYNRSDRRRWYWKCPDCADHFEASPGLDLFHLPPDDELLEIVRSADIEALAQQYGSRIICPHCGVVIPEKEKTALNAGGKWLADGQKIEPDGTISGPQPTAKIVGYWLGGVAAAYQPWVSLVRRHLQGLRDYALTGSEETLKATANTDQGVPYMSRHLVESRNAASSPQDRAEGGMQRYVVPPWTRTLLASVDIQGGSTARFVCEVHAVGPHLEQQLVDRFEIKKSKREGMGEDFAPLDPAGYPEDFDTITDRLLLSTYRTPTEGHEISVRMTTVDTGGEGKAGGGDGVTHNAYAWFRKLRKLGLSHRVMLYKGANVKSAPIIKESKVGKRNAKDKADIPLFVCNPNLLSDMVAAGLKRATHGPGYYHFPQAKHPTKNPSGWLPQAFFDELSAEVRDKDGTWRQIRSRNETFDLCRMIMAGCLRLGLDKVKNWSRVPEWLAPLDQNSSIVYAEDRRAAKENVEIAPAEPVVVVPRRAVRQRRVAASPYLR